MTKPVSFRQDDLERAIRAALNAGLKPGTFAVEAEGGKVRVLTGVTAQQQHLSPLERWERENGDRAA